MNQHHKSLTNLIFNIIVLLILNNVIILNLQLEDLTIILIGNI